MFQLFLLFLSTTAVQTVHFNVFPYPKCTLYPDYKPSVI